MDDRHFVINYFFLCYARVIYSILQLENSMMIECM